MGRTATQRHGSESHATGPLPLCAGLPTPHGVRPQVCPSVAVRLTKSASSRILCPVGRWSIPPVCCVAARGTTMPTGCVLPTATTTIQRTPRTTVVSARPRLIHLEESSGCVTGSLRTAGLKGRTMLLGRTFRPCRAQTSDRVSAGTLAAEVASRLRSALNQRQPRVWRVATSGWPPWVSTSSKSSCRSLGNGLPPLTPRPCGEADNR